jgi:hypothetical protein
MSQSLHNGEYSELNAQLMELCSYSAGHVIDADTSFLGDEQRMCQLLFSCISQSQPVTIRECALFFLTNVFRRSQTLLLPIMTSEGLIPLLFLIVGENDERLTWAALRCLANIATDSEGFRNHILELPNYQTPEHLLAAIRWYVVNSPPKIQRAAIRLFRGLCHFPAQKGLSAMIVQAIHLCFADIPESLYPGLLLALADFAGTEFGSESIVNDRFLLAFLESLIAPKAPSLVVPLLQIVARLIENGRLPESFDYDRLIALLRVWPELDPGGIVKITLQVLSNAVILHSSLVADGGLLTQTEFLEVLDEIVRRDHPAKIEALILLTNIVRETSESVLDFLGAQILGRFCGRFLDALGLYNREVVEAILCALTRMINNEEKLTSSAPTRKMCEEHRSVFDALREGDDQQITDFTVAFCDFVLKSPSRVG